MAFSYIYTPYTYLIGWSSMDKWYYGVRYSRQHKCLYESGCHPDDLWVTYFTSSKIVSKFRKQYGEPDVVQVRKTFRNESQAIEWERKVLVKINVIYDERWINCSNGDAIRTSDIDNSGKVFWNNGERNVRSRTRPGKEWSRGILLTDEQRRRIGESRTGENNSFYGKKHTEEFKKKSSERMSGKNHPFYGKKRPEHSEKMKVAMKGKIFTQEHRDNISKTHNVVYTCPHCNKSGGRIMLRWHFDNCKQKNVESASL